MTEVMSDLQQPSLVIIAGVKCTQLASAFRQLSLDDVCSFS
jgi:hypothetical protein